MFHDLPLLLQWKVLRQYVPAVDKVCTLRRMPEFGRVLDFEESWIGGRVLEKDDLASLVTPGVYVPRSLWSSGPTVQTREFGYFVTSQAKNLVTFKLIKRFDRIEKYKEFNSFYYGPGYFERAVSLKTMNDILRDFLRDFEPMDGRRTRLYESNEVGYFFVDRSLASMLWIDGMRYELRDRMSFQTLRPFRIFDMTFHVYEIELASKSEPTVSDEYEVLLKTCQCFATKESHPRRIMKPEDLTFNYRNDVTFKIEEHGDISVSGIVYTELHSFFERVMNRRRR